MEKIRIAMIVNDLNINGISNVIMSYCRRLNKEKFAPTIIAGKPIDKYYISESEKYGIKIVEMPSRKKDTKSYYKALYKELSGKKYDICHVHGNSAMITPELFIAFINGIKVRIAHSHSSTCGHMKMHKLLMPFFNMLCKHGFACSTLAGRWLFGDKKFYVLPNGFETDRFKFDSEVRISKRKELGLDDKFVIGHIGRFNGPKNHRFLLKVFDEVARKNKNAVLLLIGAGPDFDEIGALVKEHPYSDRIIIYGETSDTAPMYAAMDVFAFPSLYEGLGIVMLEAQISGLPCVASDVVPSEAVVTDNVLLISLDADVWSEKILSMREDNRAVVYDKYLSKFQKYNIEQNVRELEDIYEKLVSE